MGDSRRRRGRQLAGRGEGRRDLQPHRVQHGVHREHVGEREQPHPAAVGAEVILGSQLGLRAFGHHPARLAVQQPMDREPVLIGTHVRRPARQLHLAAVDLVGPSAQPVRPRVQQRNPHRLPALRPRLQPAARPEQLFAAVLQRRAHEA